MVKAETFQKGHDFIYRLTATRKDDGQPMESQYYISPHKAQSWRDELRKTGYGAVVARIPADAFTELTDAELDVLAQEEREK